MLGCRRVEGIINFASVFKGLYWKTLISTISDFKRNQRGENGGKERCQVLSLQYAKFKKISSEAAFLAAPGTVLMGDPCLATSPGLGGWMFTALWDTYRQDSMKMINGTVGKLCSMLNLFS